MGLSKEKLVQRIRADADRGVSIRALARKYVVGRGTVRQALRAAQPPARKTPVRTAPSLGPVPWGD